MPQVLGLDLGSYSLKGVVLEATGRGMSVLRWAETRRAEEAPLDEALAVFLAENPRRTRVVAPRPSLATHAFTLPFTDAKRIAATLLRGRGRAALRAVPGRLRPPGDPAAASATDLTVGLVRREELAELLKTLAARGLDPRVVTHPAIAYQNLFLAAPERFEVAPGAALAVLDLGHRRTSIAVGRPAEGLLFARTFPAAAAGTSRAPWRPSSRCPSPRPRPGRSGTGRSPGRRARARAGPGRRWFAPSLPWSGRPVPR